MFFILVSILSIFSVSHFLYRLFQIQCLLYLTPPWWCGITAEYSDLNPTPPTEVILIGPDTNQGLDGLDQNGQTSIESINVQVHLYSNCLFILVAQLLPNIDFLFSNSRLNIKLNVRPTPF